MLVLLVLSSSSLTMSGFETPTHTVKTTSTTESTMTSSLTWCPGTPKRAFGSFTVCSKAADYHLAPIEPPRRRSSLAFSQLLSESEVPSELPPETEAVSNLGRENVTRTPSSNIGRKRTQNTPLHRNTATPSHRAQIGRIWQDANTMMHLDVAYASSPVGSIDTRLAPLSSTGPEFRLANTPDVKQWRYSTAPQRCAQAGTDVREPFPDVEPPSSGFTTPAADVDYPALPDSSPPVSTASAGNSCGFQASASHDVSGGEIYTTYLERPLSELQLNHLPRPTSSHYSHYDLNMLDESPDQVSNSSPNIDIFCSPAAKAAADSARSKRGIPTTRLPLQNEEKVSPCPEPSVHNRNTARSCPDPSVHNHEASMLCPDPSMHRAGPHLFPPALPYRRANSRGSPLPPLKARYSNQKAFSSPPQTYDLPISFRHPVQPVYSSPLPPAEHFQPGWSTHAVPEELHVNRPGTYSFSTQAAKMTGSSAAPDSRIRDSYRTDTLTPLSKPAPRFSHTGIAAHYRRPMPISRRGTVPVGRQIMSSPPRRLGKRVREDVQPEIKKVERVDVEDVVMVDREAIHELSPNVTPYRKGAEPKRARSVSYWDQDIVGKLAGGVEGDGEAVVETMNG